MNTPKQSNKKAPPKRRSLTAELAEQLERALTIIEVTHVQGFDDARKEITATLKKAKKRLAKKPAKRNAKKKTVQAEPVSEDLPGTVKIAPGQRAEFADTKGRRAIVVEWDGETVDVRGVSIDAEETFSSALAILPASGHRLEITRRKYAGK